VSRAPDTGAHCSASACAVRNGERSLWQLRLRQRTRLLPLTPRRRRGDLRRAAGAAGAFACARFSLLEPRMQPPMPQPSTGAGFHDQLVGAGLPAGASAGQPAWTIDSIAAGRKAMADFLATARAYDILPDSNKVIVFDTAVTVRLAFYALVEHGECGVKPSPTRVPAHFPSPVQTRSARRCGTASGAPSPACSRRATSWTSCGSSTRPARGRPPPRHSQTSPSRRGGSLRAARRDFRADSARPTSGRPRPQLCGAQRMMRGRAGGGTCACAGRRPSTCRPRAGHAPA